MSVESYETVSDRQVCELPAWESWWPGLNGCSGVNNTFGYTSYVLPAGSTQYYNPFDEVITRDTRHLKGRRSGSPPFRHTPYFIGRVTTRNYLLKRKVGVAWAAAFLQYGSVPKIGSTCTRTPDHYDQVGPYESSYNLTTHLDTSTLYTVSSISAADVSAAETAVSNSAIDSALSSYDLLTDIAESREIPGLVRSISSDIYNIMRMLHGRYNINDLRAAAFMPLVELLKHPKKMLRRLGNDWMRYRYGIMPLIYSYRDIMKTMNRGQSVSTSKVQILLPQPTGVSLPSAATQYKWRETVGDVTVRASIFQYFTYSEVARLSGIGFNPFVTAWELVPYSFVIDWFVDIGSYINRATSQTLAQQSYASISRRENHSVKTWVHYPNSDQTIACAMKYSYLWFGAKPATLPSKVFYRPEESQLLTEVETDAYHRWLLPLSAARPAISINLNWRRLIDSAVMANNRLGAFSKYLKGK